MGGCSGGAALERKKQRKSRTIFRSKRKPREEEFRQIARAKKASLKFAEARRD